MQRLARSLSELRIRQPMQDSALGVILREVVAPQQGPRQSDLSAGYPGCGAPETIFFRLMIRHLEWW